MDQQVVLPPPTWYGYIHTPQFSTLTISLFCSDPDWTLEKAKQAFVVTITKHGGVCETQHVDLIEKWWAKRDVLIFFLKGSPLKVADVVME